MEIPARAKELSAIEVRRLAPGVHPIGGVAGLYLQVGTGSARSWLLRAKVGIKRREIGLGPYPEVSLAVARQIAAEMKADIRNGIDPVAKRKAARAALEASQRRGITFAEAVDRFVPIKQQELSSAKYRDQWRDSLDTYAIPVIGKKLVEDLTLHDILLVLEPIWEKIHAAADTLRRKLNEVLDFCAVKGYRTGANPARWEGNLEHALSALAGVSKEEHYPSLQLKDLTGFWEALGTRHGMGAEALRFQTLTATRTGAIRFMTWDEVDLDEGVWTVQPGRASSKIGKKEAAKRVPLTEEMVRLLRRLPRQNSGNLVFWAPRGGALSDATLGKLMKTIHEADVKAGNDGFLDAKTKEVAVPHGTRSSFKNWAIELTDFEWQLSEAALWHKLGNKVEVSYARSDLLEKRRAMMQDWGQFVRGVNAE